jgi:septal ring factor EnvC (AmiA/AmiB activator)
MSLPFLQSSVVQQLEALCELSPLCAPTHLQKQKEVNKQQQAEIAALRSKLRHSQTQLRRSEAQVQLLQQQLEAAQAIGQKD